MMDVQSIKKPRKTVKLYGRHSSIQQRKHIKEQEKQDLIEDKIDSKEYEKPFAFKGKAR